jgi:hypothetical protein
MTNIQKLVAKIAVDCQKHGIGFHLVPAKLVETDGIKCSGYFDDVDLKVAAQKEDWVDVLVHESCHMDQFLEKHPMWSKADAGITMIEKWCSGTHYSQERLVQAFKDTIELEWDCEKRTEKKIKKFRLDIDMSRYRRQVNSYLFSYWITMRDRKWYPFPYNNPKIVRRMPDEILPLKYYHDPDSPYLKYYK